MTPERIWVIYPYNDGDPVVWLSPCPFPVDDGEVVEYARVERKAQPSNIELAVLNARGGEAPVESRRYA
ncbi:MAG: hypothetical protein AB7O94_16615 [Hyphomicrobiaceae bacterium]